MAITPADIEQLTFSPSKHGYDTDEVDAFLETLTGEVDAMLKKIAELKGRLDESEGNLAKANMRVAELENAPAAAPAKADTAASERQISQALIVAQQSADRIVADARESADKIRNDADQKAREVIRQALAEKQAELDEIDRLKASREEFRAEYKTLLQHFMDDADAAFPAQVLTAATSYTPEPAPVVTPDPEATVYAPAPEAPATGIDDLD